MVAGEICGATVWGHWKRKSDKNKFCSKSSHSIRITRCKDDMLLTWVCLSECPHDVCSLCPGIWLLCLGRASKYYSSSPANRVNEWSKAASALPDILPMQYVAKPGVCQAEDFSVLAGCGFRHCHSIVNVPRSLWQISTKKHVRKQSYYELRWKIFPGLIIV